MTSTYSRHRFPREIIQHAVWLYVRFSLSLRDVEDLLAERGIDVSYETIRCWVAKFGILYARRIRRTRPRARGTWTKWLSRSEANASGSGVRWTVRARCSTSWCSAGGTEPQP